MIIGKVTGMFVFELSQNYMDERWMQHFAHLLSYTVFYLCLFIDKWF